MAWIVRLSVLLACTGALLGSGCATILSGTSQTIRVDSVPEGAHVRLGQFEGETPATFRIPKGKDYPIEVTYEGKTKHLYLSRAFDAIGVLNIFFWPGFIIDAVSGAMTKYEPDTFSVRFED